MSDYQENIDYIIDNFDFERVKKAMNAVEWCYHDSEGDVVSVAELRNMARYVLKSLIPYANRYYYLIASGGFEATVNNYEDCDKPVFKLRFVIEEWESEY